MTTGITQILFTAAAAIAAHAAGGHISMYVFSVSCFGRRALMSSNRERPSWDSAPGFVALGLLSVTMGLQGIVGKVCPLFLQCRMRLINSESVPRSTPLSS